MLSCIDLGTNPNSPNYTGPGDDERLDVQNLKTQVYLTGTGYNVYTFDMNDEASEEPTYTESFTFDQVEDCGYALFDILVQEKDPAAECCPNDHLDIAQEKGVLIVNTEWIQDKATQAFHIDEDDKHQMNLFIYSGAKFDGCTKLDFKYMRKRIGLSYSDVAENCNVRLDTAKRWEKEKYMFPPVDAWLYLDNMTEKYEAMLFDIMNDKTKITAKYVEKYNKAVFYISDPNVEYITYNQSINRKLHNAACMEAAAIYKYKDIPVHFIGYM